MNERCDRRADLFPRSSQFHVDFSVDNPYKLAYSFFCTIFIYLRFSPLLLLPALGTAHSSVRRVERIGCCSLLLLCATTLERLRRIIPSDLLADVSIGAVAVDDTFFEDPGIHITLFAARAENLVSWLRKSKCLD